MRRIDRFPMLIAHAGPGPLGLDELETVAHDRFDLEASRSGNAAFGMLRDLRAGTPFDLASDGNVTSGLTPVRQLPTP